VFGVRRGIDLESACAVMGSDDDFATLDLLDALVRKSLLVADRASGRTRFSMLETIRQFAGEATLSFALYAYGYAFGDADPAAARHAQRRGLLIAQESGNRNTETRIAGSLSHLEAEHGDPLTALDYVALALRNFHDAGNTTMIRFPLAVLAALFDRLGRDEPAAIIAGFAFSPLTSVASPELSTAIARLREALGEQAYESLARTGDQMTTAAMVAYAYDQIDQARTELNAVSKQTRLHRPGLQSQIVDTQDAVLDRSGDQC
jgi:hypothetical protein